MKRIKIEMEILIPNNITADEFSDWLFKQRNKKYICKTREHFDRADWEDIIIDESIKFEM